jgi:hypothetical protein
MPWVFGMPMSDVSMGKVIRLDIRGRHSGALNDHDDLVVGQVWKRVHGICDMLYRPRATMPNTPISTRTSDVRDGSR